MSKAKQQQVEEATAEPRLLAVKRDISYRGPDKRYYRKTIIASHYSPPLVLDFSHLSETEVKMFLRNGTLALPQKP